MPFADSMTTRAKRQREDGELKVLLDHRSVILDPDSPIQDHIVKLVGQWKNAQIVGRTQEAEAARGELLTLLKTAEGLYTAPDRVLQDELIWRGVDDHLEGRDGDYFAYGGEYIHKMFVDSLGRYVDQVEVPGVGVREKVLMSAATTAELMRLQKALRTAELGERTARAAGKPAVGAMEKRMAAEADLDSFLEANNMTLPMSRPQPEVDLVADEEGEGGSHG